MFKIVFDEDDSESQEAVDLLWKAWIMRPFREDIDSSFPGVRSSFRNRGDSTQSVQSYLEEKISAAFRGTGIPEPSGDKVSVSVSGAILRVAARSPIEGIGLSGVLTADLALKLSRSLETAATSALTSSSAMAREVKALVGGAEGKRVPIRLEEIQEKGTYLLWSFSTSVQDRTVVFFTPSFIHGNNNLAKFLKCLGVYEGLVAALEGLEDPSELLLERVKGSLASRDVSASIVVSHSQTTGKPYFKVEEMYVGDVKVWPPPTVKQLKAGYGINSEDGQ